MMEQLRRHLKPKALMIGEVMNHFVEPFLQFAMESGNSLMVHQLTK